MIWSDSFLLSGIKIGRYFEKSEEFKIARHIIQENTTSSCSEYHKEHFYQLILLYSDSINRQCLWNDENKNEGFAFSRFEDANNWFAKSD